MPLGEAVFGQLLPCPAFGGHGITTGVALFGRLTIVPAPS
jgi:hypothetical protein